MKLSLTPEPTAGITIDSTRNAPFDGAVWHIAAEAGDGLIYRIEPGTLVDVRWFTCDLLTDQDTDLAMNLEFHEPGSDKPFMCRFTLLPHTQARLRFNTGAFSFNRWRYYREGGCLKPTIGGWRVDPAKVDRIVVKVLYKAPGAARWCMTPLRAVETEPPILEEAVILNAPLLDELGQATFRDWPGKTTGEAEMVARLNEQLAQAAQPREEGNLSRWGGWSSRRVEASGFFRTYNDGSRWWMVDPDGFLFWSAGADCVDPKVESNIRLLHNALAFLPEQQGKYAPCFEPASGENEPFDYLVANLIRAFGEKWRERWAELVYPMMRGIGFNTCGNWSDCNAASKARMPYVFPMPDVPVSEQKVARIFRDFPDVFDPAFELEAERFAKPLASLASDPAMIGYFLMNEPKWGFARMLAAEGMIRNAADCATRRAFGDQLRGKYSTDRALAEAWQMEVTLDEVTKGEWTRPFAEAAYADIEAFSTVMVRKLYETLSAACRRVDPHHLNLGARFASAPENWIINAIGCFDVFSINCYQLVADDKLGDICKRLNVPAMIGEWHFGAIDAGLPAPGIGHAANQAERGKAYRYFVEQSASRQWCVGAHWFTLYDQSALGRSDGENYNIGFIDTCHRLYPELTGAARTTHGRLYSVATGESAPFGEAPLIVGRLNM